jgi:capsular exopolysaccharide synthesis family protein
MSEMRTKLGLEGAIARQPNFTSDGDSALSGALPWEAATRQHRERFDSFVPENIAEKPSSTFTLSALLGLVRRQIWLIVCITILVSIVAIFVAMLLKERYTATALVRLDERSSHLIELTAPNAPGADGEVEILKSDDVALQVVERLGLDRNTDYMPQPRRLSRIFAAAKDFLPSSILKRVGASQAEQGTANSAISKPISDPVAASIRILQKNVTIRRRGLTDVIAIEVTTSNPQSAAQIANAFAEAYLDQQVVAKLNGIERAEQALSRRLNELNDELRRSEMQVGLRQVYQDNLARLKAISQQRDTVGPDARIASRARAPDVPSFPPRGLLAIIGTMTGFGLALGVAYLRDSHTRGVQAEEELELISGVPNLAALPLVPKSKTKNRLLPDDGVVRPPSAYSEAIRRLYFSLQLSVNRGPKLGLLLVTSAGAREGKSTMALSLARSAAIAGSRVVIVDSDLRRPTLHELLGLPNDGGFAELLAHPAAARSMLQPDPHSSCRVLTAGKIEMIQPAQVLTVEGLRGILRGLAAEFDLVILDAPPLGEHADALILMHDIDAVLFVVRAGGPNPAEIRSSLRQLSRCSDVDVFTVLNFKSCWG